VLADPTIQRKKIKNGAPDVGKYVNVDGFGLPKTYKVLVFRGVFDVFPNTLLHSLHVRFDELPHIAHQPATRIVASKQMQEYGFGRCARLSFRNAVHCQAGWLARAG
jgi:hypothetical protein